MHKRCRDDLHTVKLGSWTTDQIERNFFGEVNSRGCEAVLHFADYGGASKSHMGCRQRSFRRIWARRSSERQMIPSNFHASSLEVGFHFNGFNLLIGDVVYAS